jgi:isoleucyl-tRNA synthetase
MSKSVGNVVNPMDIINKNGADVFRLWAMSSDFKEDLKLGPSNIKQVSDQYRKVRNTFRFLLGNVNANDFDPKKDMVAYENLEKTDKYVMIRLNDTVKAVREAVLAYDYLAANKALVNFMTNDLSSFYCDFTKDILYCSAKNDKRRRQVQSVYWQTVDALARLWAPFLVFTAEEVWQHFNDDSAESVHYTHFPEVQKYADEDEIRDMFTKLLDVRTDVLKALEESRNSKLIGTAQEAEVDLTLTGEEDELLEKGLGDTAAQWLIVSKAAVETGSERAVKIVRAQGTKCPRCWNYSEDADENGLCPRCHKVMQEEK